MAVAKKEQERVTYASMYGAQASKDGKDRVVPAFWADLAESWLEGFNAEPGAAKTKPVSDNMEAEVDEAAVDRPAGT